MRQETETNTQTAKYRDGDEQRRSDKVTEAEKEEEAEATVDATGDVLVDEHRKKKMERRKLTNHRRKAGRGEKRNRKKR